MKIVLLWISSLIGLASCHYKAEPTSTAELASGQVKFLLPKSWSLHEIRPVFPPDCASCSGTEHNEFFGGNSDAGVVVIVKVFPEGIVSSPSSEDEVSGVKEKNPGGTVEDTISEIRNGYKYTSITYRQADDTMPYYYHVLTIWAGQYRTVVAHFGGKDTDDFRETVAEIQKSVRVNSAFLNTAKL